MFRYGWVHVSGFWVGKIKTLKYFCWALCALACDSLRAAPSIHEQLLATDAALRETDRIHSNVYGSVRARLSEADKQALKDDQLRWLASLNQASFRRRLT